MNSDETKMYLLAFNTASNSHDEVLKSQIVKAENLAIGQAENFFREVGSKNKLVDIIQLESLFLDEKVSHNANIDASRGEPHAVSGEERTRLTNCFNRSVTALELARDNENYDNYVGFLLNNKTVSFDKDGLPNDLFREFIKVDIDAIRNEQASSVSDATKSRNVARIENLRKAEKLYKEMIKGHMERFAEEHPNHENALKFLSHQKKDLNIVR
ncbi:MAG: hypothetical protein IJ228_01070 [Succinivibrio sp.]|nr:hypothetical protein [Succinivibrio sp.]